MTEIVKAQESDIAGIAEIYERIHDCEESGSAVIGWIRGVYPTGKTAEDALRRGDLFVMKDGGRLVASAVINQVQMDAYRHAAWKYDAKDEEVMVLHCLVVDPREKSRGCGRAFVAFYESCAKSRGCRYLRMDTNALNTRARELYRTLRYEETGIVSCVFNGIPDVRLVCLEKAI